MKYMGSKSRISKFIVPIIQTYIDENKIETYIEPFCGGCNIIDKISCRNKVAADNNHYLISMLNNIHRFAELPEFVTKEHYADVRDCFNSGLNKYEDWYIGAIGFLASYNGRFFDGGYAGRVNTASGVCRDYYLEAKKNVLAQKLDSIDFLCCDYLDTNVYANSLLYCDPPYNGTKKYNSSVGFNYDTFWNWAREKSVDNIVIISEQNAPDDFSCIWEKETLRTIDNTKRVTSIEKLFILGAEK